MISTYLGLSRGRIRLHVLFLRPVSIIGTDYIRGIVIGRILYLSFRNGVHPVPFIRNKGKQRISGIATVSLINSWLAVLLIHILHPEIQFPLAQLNILLIDYGPANLVGLSIISFDITIYISVWVAQKKPGG